MRFFSKASVTVIGKTIVEHDDLSSALSALGYEFDSDSHYDADFLSEAAGRICYMSFNPEKRRKSGEGQNKAYLDHIKEVGHLSVIEHASWNFLISNVSRNLTHELIRHRVGTAISQVSSRYVDQVEHNLGYYLSPELDSEDVAARRYTIAICEDHYHNLFDKLRKKGMKAKEARSIARHELHGSAGTALVWTCNARELNHIFSLRGSIHADPEIRTLAVELWRQVKDVEIFSHWEEVNGELRNKPTASSVTPPPPSSSSATPVPPSTDPAKPNETLTELLRRMRPTLNWPFTRFA